jgi:hypothetical protein
MSRFRSTALAALFAAATALVAGCQDEEQIQQYTVVKPEVLTASGRVATPSAESETPLQDTGSQAPIPTRILGAILPQPGQTWYFKIMGPDEGVAGQEPAFREFLASLKFESGRPTWTLPAGWREQPSAAGGGLRFATILLPSEGPPLELTVIQLQSADDAEQSLLDNVNRWRGQLALRPVSRDELPESVEKLVLGDIEATLVNMAGQAAPTNPMGMPPFASRGGGAGGFQHPPIPDREDRRDRPAAAASLPIAFDVPEGWRPGRTNAFRLAAFEVGTAGNTAEITVSKMSFQELLPNVNRWRGQVGLEPVTDEALQNDVREIEVDGAAGHLMALAGPEQTILAAILNRAGESWIFKLQGPSGLAAEEKDRFDAFVRSVKFK